MPAQTSLLLSLSSRADLGQTQSREE